MKGLASNRTLTGKLQRALSSQWKTQAELMRDAGLSNHGKQGATVQECLQRLVREGRAASGFFSIADAAGRPSHRVSVYRSRGPQGE